MDQALCYNVWRRVVFARAVCEKDRGLMHRPLITFDVSETGEQVTLKIISNDHGYQKIPVRAEHLPDVALAFVALCGILGIELNQSAANVVPFGTAEERRMAEARYAEFIRQAEAKAEAAEH